MCGYIAAGIYSSGDYVMNDNMTNYSVIRNMAEYSYRSSRGPAVVMVFEYFSRVFASVIRCVIKRV